MPGPPPAAQRRRRNADVYADVQATIPQAMPTMRGPTLAKATADESVTWTPRIKALVGVWWDTWRLSPLTETFLDTDWQRLAMLAPLVASYYARPHHLTLAEIRQNESLLGATHADRLRARIKVAPKSTETAVPPGVVAIDAYRQQLAG